MGNLLKGSQPVNSSGIRDFGKGKIDTMVGGGSMGILLRWSLHLPDFSANLVHHS
jgi:hypothetical protein